MANNRYGSKQDEYDFFSNAFELIDEHYKSSFSNSKCSSVYRRLASKTADGRIEKWNEIPLTNIYKSGSAGYQQAVETVFLAFEGICKSSENEFVRYRIERLIQDAVAVLSRRISDVERGGLMMDEYNARETGNDLQVIELWSRCLKDSIQRIPHWKYQKRLKICGMLLPQFLVLLFSFLVCSVAMIEVGLTVYEDYTGQPSV